MERRRRRRGEDGAPLNWSLSSLLGPLRGRRGSAQGPAASPAQRASDISRLLEATDSDGEGFFFCSCFSPLIGSDAPQRFCNTR